MPPLDRPARSEILHRFDRPIESHPAHQPRMGKVPRLSPHLPDACIGLVPLAFQMSKDRLLQCPCVFAALKTELASDMQGVHQFAGHIELTLREPSVADAYRLAAFVA